MRIDDVFSYWLVTGAQAGVSVAAQIRSEKRWRGAVFNLCTARRSIRMEGYIPCHLNVTRIDDRVSTDEDGYFVNPAFLSD